MMTAPLQHLTLGYLTLNAPPAETIAAAASAGFKSVGIRITGRRVGEDYTPVVGNPRMIRELRQRLDDAGLRLSNVTAYHLFPDVTLAHMQAVIDATAELGAKILLAHAYVPIDQKLIELFSAYSAYAGQSDIRIAAEFMRYTQAPTLDAATRWLDMAGASNAGYVIDPLHLDRSGATPADLKRIDPERIVFVQLCDARKRNDNPSNEQLLFEARNERVLPGDGDLPLHEFLDALPPGIEIEYEVPRPIDAGLPLDQRARIAADAFQRFMAEHARRRGQAGRPETAR